MGLQHLHDVLVDAPRAADSAAVVVVGVVRMCMECQVFVLSYSGVRQSDSQGVHNNREVA